MALTGLRPIRETNSLGDSRSHYNLLNGAYDLYVQDEYDLADADQVYYAAKWIKLKAGSYEVRTFVKDSAVFSLDGTVIIEATHDPEVPQLHQFTVAKNGVYRFDIQYQTEAQNGAAYICYQIRLGDVVVEVSRANKFVADLTTIPTSALGTKPPFSDDERLTLPVFLPSPNWKDGITERIEWLTDVLVSESGAEQRRNLRITPRRSLEASFVRFNENRGILDSTIVGAGITPMLVPLWYDMTRCSVGSPAGSSVLQGDFTGKEFSIGRVVLIRRGDIFDYEVNVIAEVTENNIKLAYGIQYDTPAGSSITPAIKSRIKESVNGSVLTDAVTSYQIRFHLEELYQEIPDWGMDVYTKTGLPIFNWKPNYRQQMATTVDRVFYQVDNQTGVAGIIDPGGSAFGSVKMSFTLTGLEENARFRRMLFAMCGRQKSFHIPSGTSDFELAQDVDPAQGALIIHRSGYTQFLDAGQSIRRDIVIELYDGTLLPNTVISSRIVGELEWLFLSETTREISLSEVRRISYLPIGRLNVDAVEFNRLTDSRGTSVVSLTFKTFDPRRKETPI